MSFRGPKGQLQPRLFLPEGMADALADVMQQAAPVGRRKYIEKRLKMGADDARRVAEGRASKAQLDHAFKVGGWPLVLEVFARLLGEGLDQHLERERRRYAEQDQRLGAMVGGLRALAGAGPDASGGVGSADRRLAAVHARRLGERSAARPSD